MNRKDGGKEGRTREGGRGRERALSWSPEENFRERGQGGGRQCWGTRRNAGKEEEIFRVFRGKKRKKEG